MDQELTVGNLRNKIITDLTALMDPGEARSTASIILEYLGIARAGMPADPNQVLHNKIQTEVNKIVTQLHRQEPIQYILGETSFFDLRLLVNQNVLIPRQETEEMVAHIIREYEHRSPVLLDLGTGSGCIAIALKKNIPRARVFALEVDFKALRVAERNAGMHNTEINFIQADMRNLNPGEIPSGLDLVVSNPPYVTQADRLLMQPNVLEYEPELALFPPEEDPLVFFRAIAEISRHQLKPGGIVWTEINEALGDETLAVFEAAGFAGSTLIRDINEKHRFIRAEKNDTV